ITHGLSGSGKTWLSQQLLESLGAIRLRSDVERKRLHGLAPHARSGSAIDSGIYTAAAGRRTYARLAELAHVILRAGHPVIVDAAFLKRHQRDQLRVVADQTRVPFVILDVQTPESVLRARLQQRSRQSLEASEADLAVLDRQLASHEPLTADEQRHVLVVDGAAAADIAGLASKLRARIGLA
ncbi:MAG: ATP-binding protein, partial [Pseudomonadota bacterium]